MTGNQFDEKNDVKLPASYRTTGKNRIAIALLDDGRAHNTLKDTVLEIVPKP